MAKENNPEFNKAKEPQIGVMDMIKKVGIQVDGSGTAPTDFFVVTPDTTTQELLSRANLSNYELCPSSSELPFGQNEEIFDKVGDNTVLYAYRQATVGSFQPISQQYPSLLDQRGWWKDGPYYFGYFRTRYGSFQGKIRERTFDIGDFFIKDPPPVLKSHEHWACFTDKGDGWHSIHFEFAPESMSEGIKSIESVLISAFKQNLSEV